jgi:hypothetical protein
MPRLLPVRRLAAIAALACAGASLVPVSAQAQLPGRLKKMGKDMLKNKIAGKDSTASADKSDAAATSSAPAANASADYTITDDRITVVLAALGPAVQRASLAAAAAADQKTYEATKEKVTSCIQANTPAGTMPSQANMQASAKVSEKLAAVTPRVNEALLANDFRRYVYASDTVSVLAASTTSTMFGLTAKCGTMPYAPKALLELEILKRQSKSGEEAAGYVIVDDATQQKLTRVQFGMIRERIALWSMMKTGTPVNSLGKQGVFTEEELAALDAHGAEIMKLAPLFKGKTLTWSGTSDLSGW